MKKILFCLSLIYGITSSFAEDPLPVASPFNGFYIGVTGGNSRVETHGVLETNLVRLFPLRVINKESYYTARGTGNKTYSEFSYGAIIGYGKVLNNIYLGIEANIQDRVANNKAQAYSDYLRHNNPNYDSQFRASTEYKRGIAFGLMPKIGYPINRNHLIYAKLGIETSKDYVTGQYMNGQYKVFKSGNKHNLVWIPGFGFEKAFSDNVLVKVEYGYNLGANFSRTINYNEEENWLFTFKNQIKYTAHEIKIGVSFKL